MRKYFFMLLLIPAIGMGQAKTILTSNRIFAKNDKVSEFEKALATHAQNIIRVMLGGGYGQLNQVLMQAVTWLQKASAAGVFWIAVTILAQNIPTIGKKMFYPLYDKKIKEIYLDMRTELKGAGLVV